MAHVEGIGDTEWATEGAFVGTRGQSKRIEGFAIRLAGSEAASYRVFYTAHVSRAGDMEIASDGAYCGTRGRSLPVEGMKVWIDRTTVARSPAVPPEDPAATLRVPNKPQPDRLAAADEDEDVIIFGPAAADAVPAESGRAAASSVAIAPTAVGLRIVTHMQGTGTRTFREKEYAGTRGEFRPLEGFEIEIDPPIPGLSLHYRGYVAGVGDTPWLETGQFLGARDRGKQIEGFSIRLDGPEASKYDVFYTAHVARVGDTQICSNGQYCGTKGRSLPIEGLQVWVEPKA